MRYLTLAILLGAVSTTAHADLEIRDDPSYGAGAVTRDTATGLDWLYLNLTTGLSVDAVLAGTGGFIEDFDIATWAR